MFYCLGKALHQYSRSHVTRTSTVFTEYASFSSQSTDLRQIEGVPTHGAIHAPISRNIECVSFFNDAHMLMGEAERLSRIPRCGRSRDEFSSVLERLGEIEPQKYLVAVFHSLHGKHLVPSCPHENFLLVPILVPQPEAKTASPSRRDTTARREIPR